MNNMYRLTEEGKKYLKEGLPEENLLILLEKRREITIEEARNKIDNFHIALQWAKTNKWIEVKNGKIVLLYGGGDFHLKKSLGNVAKGEKTDQQYLSILIKRRLVEEERETEYKKAEKLVGKEIANLNPELIKTGMWKKVTLKKYNVEATGKKIYPGKKHVISYYIEKIRNVFFDLGFIESEGPFVESSFWNFDALYQPQDHPSRELADTFYMKTPSVSRLPDKGLVDSVKGAHENGSNTGSTGWRYVWDEKIASQSILRTHTTAVSARMLTKIEPPTKVFCIGRVFRNETLDYKHLPEFTQVEGIVVDENVGFRDLLGYLREFYLRLGFKKIRFRPSYFPYTEMSVEPEVYMEERKEWLELGGAGVFRPEVTRPLGIDCPVLAWGLGLERPIILKLALNDIRNFYDKNDLKLLRGISWL